MGRDARRLCRGGAADRGDREERRALLVYGVAICSDGTCLSNFEMEDWRSQTIVSLLERAGPTRLFTIIGLKEKHASGWEPPALARIRGTTLGAIDASKYFGPGRRFVVRHDEIVPVPEEQWRKLRGRAVRYVAVPGPHSTNAG